MTDIGNTLTEKEALKTELLNLVNILSLNELRSVLSFVKEIIDNRESKPDYCPYCQSKKIVRNGKRHGKQAYICRNCKKTFVSTFGTLQYRSHQSKDDWAKAIESTLNGDSLDDLSEDIGVSHPTAFNMRHKVLYALEMEFTPEIKDCGDPDIIDVEFSSTEEAQVDETEGHSSAIETLEPEFERSQQETKSMEDTIPLYDPYNLPHSPDVKELDETYVLDDFKGKRLPVNFYRRPRKHGAKALLRGLSFEHICICTAVKREGGAYARSINRAVPSSDELVEVFSDQLAPGTLILCDGLKGYKKLSDATGCTLRNVNTAPDADVNLYNLNKVNSFHSMIKQMHRRYRGVATKYQNRYNILYCVAYKATSDRQKIIIDFLLTHSRTIHSNTIRDVHVSNLLPLGNTEGLTV